jgi:Lipoprotein LpqB beta-propeller domain/Sporulation and spore germination
MARRRLRRIAALVAGLTVLALAAGCGGIPRSGPVHAGAQLDGPPPVRVLAAPPVAGSSAEEVIRGFLRAQPGLDDDAAVARSYLVGDLTRTWATRPRVVVYPDESALRVVAGPAGTFTVTMPVLATVDPTGVYEDGTANAKETLQLKVVQTQGEWRISSIGDPQTRWLTSFDLDRVYVQVPLYYGAPGSKVLVPDVRWFPATSGLATIVAQAQLEPPPAYLRSAVVTGAVRGTALAVGSVPTAGNLASIDLTSSARNLSSAERTLLWAQLAAAVTQTSGVDSVRLLAGDKLLDIPGQAVAGGTTAGALGYSIDAAPSASAVGLSVADGHGELAQLSSGASATVAPAKATLPSFDVPLRSLARSSDGREFAGVDTSGHALLRIVDGRTTTALAAPGDLTGPSYDPRRWIWAGSSGAGAPTRIYAVPDTAAGKEGGAVALAAPWLEGRAVTAVQVSRDGARLLVASNGRTGWRLDVAGIVRDARGKPLSLSPAPLRIGVGLADIVDATWVDATSVGVVGRRATDQTRQPYLVTVSGEVVSLPEVPEATRIAAGAGASSLTVVTAKGDVLGRGGSSGWVAIGRGLDVAFPG